MSRAPLREQLSELERKARRTQFWLRVALVAFALYVAGTAALYLFWFST